MMMTPLTRAATVGPAAARARSQALVSLLAAIVCLAVRWPFLAAPGFIHDQVVFLHWASLAERTGVASVYEPRRDGWPICTYPPLYPYVLRTLAAAHRLGTGHSITPAVIMDVVAQRQTPESAAACALFKMPGVIADALTAALLVLWLSRRVSLRTAAAISLAYAIMPAVAFNSAVWGQVDSISTLFTMIALECLTRRRWVWVGVFAAASVLTKPQAVLFVPLFGIAAVFADRQKAVSSTLRFAIGGSIVAFAVLAPIWSARANIARAFTDATGLYPLVHLNGFSAWFLANSLPAPRLNELATYYRRDDLAMVFGITPRLAGLAALGVLAATVLFRVARLRAGEPAVRFATRVLPLAFMVLSTQMHERYLVPALAFWAWAYQPSVRWWVGWCVIGAVAAINLLWVWEQPLLIESASTFSAWTRTTHAGVTTGVYCAIALIAVLMSLLLGFDRRPHASAAITS